jgi:NADH-quinone oxidoreductase subunit M
MTAGVTDIRLAEKLALGVIVILIFWMGIYPQPVLDMTKEISETILKKSEVPYLLRR